MSRLAVLVLTVPALVFSAAGVAQALPKWQVSATLSLGTESVAVDCPRPSACWSLESGRLLSSADGGQSWTDRTDLVPAGIEALDALDCLNPRRCYVAATGAGTAALLYLDDGTVTEHAVPGAPSLSTISCTPPRHCVGATGTTSYVTDDGGATWNTGSLGRTLLGRTAVECVAASSVCYLVGNYGLVPTILKSVSRGRSWTLQTAPYDDGGIYDVACPTVLECYATGANYSDYAVVVRTVDGGSHWTFAQVPAHPYPLRSVSCPSASACTAIGQSPGNTPFVYATTDGQQWGAQAIPAIATEQPGQVSCPTTVSCAAVASAAAFATVDGGTRWQAVGVPAGLEAPSAIVCASATRCAGSGTDAAGKPFLITTSDFGTTWSLGTLPTDGGRLGGIDCPTASTCYTSAVTSIPGTTRSRTQFLRSTDGGRTWAVTVTHSGTARGIVCPTDTNCLAAGDDNQHQYRLLRTTDSGAHWARVEPPGTATLVGFACGTATSCVFVMGTYGGTWTAFTTADLGATYAPHVMPAADWFGMDCAGQFCMVAGYGAIATSSDGGGTWDEETVPPGAQLIDSVSCGGPRSCAGSTYDFDYETGGARIVGTTDGGATWRVHAVPARHQAPIDVACFRSRCIASAYTTAGNPIIVAGSA